MLEESDVRSEVLLMRVCRQRHGCVCLVGAKPAERCRKRKGDEVGYRWLVSLAPEVNKKVEQLAMAIASDPSMLLKLERGRYAKGKARCDRRCSALKGGGENYVYKDVTTLGSPDTKEDQSYIPYTLMVALR